MNNKGTVLIIDNDINCTISRRGVLTRNGYMEYRSSEWDSYEEYARGLTSRESALQQLTHLMETVNTAGKGEVWIESDTDRGYLFRMRQ